ncbi:GNAT family N-acetyltransferase [Persicobacter diffluens]|uniref:N-acetyltransferase n=1 Tax=Persicobacter diffluens TaxID=981 RepID=A0AAN4VSY0_9BACT|nr:N-acetyltransferase [Persicobacter diffluens]
MIIREITQNDDKAIAHIIRKSLEEYGENKAGTIYFDPILDHMSDQYQQEDSAYFVIEENHQILGGAGIAPLIGEHQKTCELQRIFLKASARGKGLGKMLMEQCLHFARSQAYQQVYLETLPSLKEAVLLYEKYGFQKLEKSMGNTGHAACDLPMLLKL